MYELQIEKGVEKDIKDLKKSSSVEFNRIISHIMDLKNNQDPQMLERLLVQKMTGD